jgi:hypothetical protein
VQLHWNYWAFWLELRGQSVFLQVWAAGLAFFAANIVAMVALLRGHTYAPVFVRGRLAPLPGADAVDGERVAVAPPAGGKGGADEVADDADVADGGAAGSGGGAKRAGRAAGRAAASPARASSSSSGAGARRRR